MLAAAITRSALGLAKASVSRTACQCSCRGDSDSNSDLEWSLMTGKGQIECIACCICCTGRVKVHCPSVMAVADGDSSIVTREALDTSS